MKRLMFRCTLVSDVILNQTAATEGGNSTLDFIPGNIFLGVLAQRYAEFGDKAMEVFHSGRVRFGDAHPVCADGKHEGVRSLRVPALLFYPKMKSAEDVCYVHSAYDRSKDTSNNGRPQQLKQCRSGFYAFDDAGGHKAEVEKAFAIKSAYDRSSRRAKDEMMYGYESLAEGTQFLFSVEVDDDALADDIRRGMLGRHKIGRSRTAQYGLADIEEHAFTEVASGAKLMKGNDGMEYVTVYADGRLIFLDDSGEPTATPSAHDLGVEGGEIDWMRSQVRTFQYAPWNGKRSTRDAERFGVEKGSVFVVKVNGQAQQFCSRYVGCYRNEGFGKVIYNPSFLDVAGGNGKAKCTLNPAADKERKLNPYGKPLSGTPLLDYLRRKKQEAQIEQMIYREVNAFVEANKGRFSGDKFASQWGTIRSIASQHFTCEDIMYELYDKKKQKTRTKDNIKVEEPFAYLTHGVAAEKWRKGGRDAILKGFIKRVYDQGRLMCGCDCVSTALINLAAEMGKLKNEK